MASELPLLPRSLERLIKQWASRRLNPPSSEAIINRQRLYILPTSHGVTIFTILLLILLGAINYENSLGYMLAFLMGALGFLSMVHTHQNINHMKLQLANPRPVFAGQLAHFPLTLSFKRPGMHPALQVQAENGDAICAHLLDDTAIDIMLPVATHQRGYMPIPRLKIFSEFPLGLFHAWSWVQLESHCLVYPTPAPSHLPVSHTSSDPLGQQSSESTGVDEFAGIRKYQPGDPPSHMAWKAIARTGELQSKLFTSDSSNDLHIRWDSLNPGLDTEKRLSILCRLVIDAHDHGLSYSFDIPGTSLPSASGQHHRDLCLKALALFGTQPV